MLYLTSLYTDDMMFIQLGVVVCRPIRTCQRQLMHLEREADVFQNDAIGGRVRQLVPFNQGSFL